MNKKIMIWCWSCGTPTEVDYIGENSHRQECPKCQEVRAERYKIMRANSEKARAENEQVSRNT